MAIQSKGSFVLVLHSHLPWVTNHGTWPHGTSWLMEAAAECYVPLLDAFHRLAADGIAPKVTIGITPVLAEMLAHPSFPAEFEGYCRARAAAADEDKQTFARTGSPKLERLAATFADEYRRVRERFRGPYRADLVGAFRRLQDEGQLEVITCAATHGYLPLLGRDECVNAQVALGQASYAARFGRKAAGVWMPECAYRPAGPWTRPIGGNGGSAFPRRGVDEFLLERGLRFTVVDTHLLKGGETLGVYADRHGILRELLPASEAGRNRGGATGSRGPVTPQEVYAASSAATAGRKVDGALGILTRDPDTSLQVWSGEHGYPGDGAYREFHKKAFPSGHQYWRVTSAKSDLGAKEIYDPEPVLARIRTHADHFVSVVSGILGKHRERTGTPGVVAAPFDTELFGHWWFEGPRWIEQVFRTFARSDVSVVTGSELLDANPPKEVVRLPEGSWGEGGGHWVWFNPRTQWTWKRIYDAEDKVVRLIQKAGSAPPPEARPYLEQLARQLLLLEASDWQFLITTVAAADYAEQRFAQHAEEIDRLHGIAVRALEGAPPDPGATAWFEELTRRDDLFPTIDLSWWRSTGG